MSGQWSDAGLLNAEFTFFIKNNNYGSYLLSIPDKTLELFPKFALVS